MNWVTELEISAMMSKMLCTLKEDEEEEERSEYGEW